MVKSVCSDVVLGETNLPNYSTGNVDELGPILKSIIVTRSKEGATVDEIIADYFDFTGDNLLSLCRDRDSIADTLRKIEGIWCSFMPPNGPYLWYCSSQNTKHLTEMIKKQKSPRFQNRRYHQQQQKQQQQQQQYQPNRTPYPQRQRTSMTTTSNNGTTTSSSTSAGPRDKFYQDNVNFIPKRNAWNRTAARSNHPYMGTAQWRQPVQPVKPMRKPMHQQSMMQPMPNYYSYQEMRSVPTFCGLQMIGDDFFLSLARWELGFHFDPGHNIQQSGLCISGLTIAEAADRVMKATYINDRVIVNVGVVDLLHGHDLVDMQQDLLQLMKNLEIRGVTAILTTLSPLANSSHIPGITDRLHKFNEMIRRYHYQYIDLWRCFVNERNNTLYECFQPGPRQVTGSNQPHVLWNKLGRQMVIKYIKTELAGLIVHS